MLDLGPEAALKLSLLVSDVLRLFSEPARPPSSSFRCAEVSTRVVKIELIAEMLSVSYFEIPELDELYKNDNAQQSSQKRNSKNTGFANFTTCNEEIIRCTLGLSSLPSPLSK